MQKTKSSPHDTIKKMVLIAMLSALVFVASWLYIPFGESRFHLGNIMCILAGLLFGPFIGGLSAGFGSMLFDLTNPVYAPEFWITFLTKFAMGYVAGALFKGLPAKLPAILRYTVSAFGGAALYVLLYMGKSALWLHFLSGTPWPAVWPVVIAKGSVSAINGLVAIVASVILAPLLRKALNASGLFTTIQKST